MSSNAKYCSIMLEAEYYGTSKSFRNSCNVFGLNKQIEDHIKISKKIGVGNSYSSGMWTTSLNPLAVIK